MNVRRRSPAVVAILCLLAPGIFVRPLRAATPAEVEASIAKGKKYLYSLQRPEGRWEPDAQRKGNKHGDHPQMQGQSWGGFTAIATYALLASGENPQDPRVTRAVNFLKNADITGVYAQGVRCQVWTLLKPGAEVRALAKRDAGVLLNTLNAGGDGKGGWDYDDPTNKGGRIDHSVSQYGVLGLWAAARIGYEVNPKVWELIDATWRAHQYDDGSWAYDNDGHGKGGPSQPTASMTAAGVATLFITQDYLRANEGLGCQGNVANENIDKGLRWMSEHFDQVHGNNYAWYGVERIGVASGYKYFGSKDWYAEGAEELVRRQRPDGSWVGGFPGGEQPIPATAFALLFLTRGRAPVIMNKLDYTPVAADGEAAGGGSPAKAPKITAHWNQRPRDVANLATWMATQTERDLNWQIVNLSAPPEDLHDAPILFIAGSQGLNLSDADAAKLRAFVEQGGLILGNGDCAKEVFNKSFRKLGKQLFPKYEFRELPAAHVIFKEQQYDGDKWRNRPKVQGLGNGVRELMLLVPDADPAKAWQTRSDKAREDLFQLGANIFMYAVDKKDLLYKGETFVVKDKGVEPARTIKVARLMVGANPDPEPGGWRRLGNVLKNDFKLGVTVEPVALGAAGGGLAGFQVAHLTGTTVFSLNDAGRKEIQGFVNGGGTLVVDAAGGSASFADAAETELAAVFGAAATKGMARPLPADHPVYAQAGAKIGGFAYRRYARKAVVGETRGPRVKGIKVGDRVAVFYSREDLSGGMVGAPVDGIVGYNVATATQVMRNIVLYAAAGGNVATAPADATATSAPKPKTAGPFDRAAHDPKAPAQPKPAETKDPADAAPF